MTMLADMIGSVIWGLPKLLTQDESIISRNIGKILVIRTAYIGDVVMTLPILKPLKEKFPGAKLTFLTSTTARPVLENNPYVDEIVTFDAFWFYASGKEEYSRFISSFRQREFDLVIEARGDIRDLLFLVRPLRSRYKISSGIGGGTYFLTHVVPGDGRKHRVDYHLDMARFLGCRPEALEWGIYPTNEERTAVDCTLTDAGISQPFISAHPGSRLSLKTWPLEKCAELYDRIMEEYNLPLVLLGTAEEKAQVRDIMARMKHRPTDLSGRLSLRELAGVLTMSALFICNDSAPMHIAAAVKTPIVAIFGPSKSRETGPYGGKHHRVVEKEFACRHTCDENKCKHKVYNACMHAIAVDDVFGVVKELMLELKT